MPVLSVGVAENGGYMPKATGVAETVQLAAPAVAGQIRASAASAAGAHWGVSWQVSGPIVGISPGAGV